MTHVPFDETQPPPGGMSSALWVGVGCLLLLVLGVLGGAGAIVYLGFSRVDPRQVEQEEARGYVVQLRPLLQDMEQVVRQGGVVFVRPADTDYDAWSASNGQALLSGLRPRDRAAVRSASVMLLERRDANSASYASLGTYAGPQIAGQVRSRQGFVDERGFARVDPSYAFAAGPDGRAYVVVHGQRELDLNGQVYVIELEVEFPRADRDP